MSPVRPFEDMWDFLPRDHLYGGYRIGKPMVMSKLLRYGGGCGGGGGGLGGYGGGGVSDGGRGPAPVMPGPPDGTLMPANPGGVAGGIVAGVRTGQIPTPPAPTLEALTAMANGPNAYGPKADAMLLLLERKQAGNNPTDAQWRATVPPYDELCLKPLSALAPSTRQQLGSLVGVLYDPVRKEFFCAATRLTAQYLITARHCLYADSRNPTTFRAIDQLKFFSLDQPRREILVEKPFAPPQDVWTTKEFSLALQEENFVLLRTVSVPLSRVPSRAPIRPSTNGCLSSAPAMSRWNSRERRVRFSAPTTERGWTTCASTTLFPVWPSGARHSACFMRARRRQCPVVAQSSW